MVIPNADEVLEILEGLVGDYPDAYEEVCKVCDLLGLRRPPKPR